ncbi:MAG TPA: hypothetical protein H9878_06985 [Candidatus Dietzia merdigallinarum]|nr:hypothetical protein [Candidatus Dietzia merdigallinarum]
MRFSNTSNAHAGDGGSTIIDKEFNDYRVMAEEFGIPLAPDRPTGGFSRERDWFFNAEGRDVHPRGRWLVTLAHADTDDAASLHPDPQAPASGWLIAYEIDSDDRKTNRVIALAGPWTLHTDKVLHSECPLSDPDLDELLSWLRSRGV